MCTKLSQPMKKFRQCVSNFPSIVSHSCEKCACSQIDVTYSIHSFYPHFSCHRSGWSSLLASRYRIYVSLSKMEQSLSLMVFSQARCPRFAFSMHNIIIRDALLEPHAISRFRVCYLKQRDARSAILSIFTVSPGQGK